jgi:hypothetical protein
MEKEALKRIFEFLKDKEQHNLPFVWMQKNNIPFTEEELNVKGNLVLDYTEITSLPEGLKVGGNLDLHRCRELTSLPEGLKVGGGLYIRGTNITSLPKGLKVGNSLFIGDTPLEKYTDDELREMIKPGFIKGVILR